MLKIFLNNIFFGNIIRIIDAFIPKKNNYWGFSVHHIKSHQFIENARAVFEEVKKDREIKKILFTRDDFIDFDIEDAQNLEIIKLVTPRGLLLFMQCKVLFVTHSLSMDYSFRYGKSNFSVIKLDLNKRCLVNLWHGIPLKRLYGAASNEVARHLDRVKYRHYERKKYRGLICSSDVDSYAMTTIFQPIKYKNVWITGLPRNDYLLIKDENLPFYLQKQISIIKQIKNGRKLIIYAPTYRQTNVVTDSEYYQFSHQEIDKLKGLLKKHNAILGFRMHYFRNNQTLFNMESYVDNELIFTMGHEIIPDIAPVIREADVIISDYSSVFIDALYVNKPVFAFTYDFDHYKTRQEGFLYNFHAIFPGTMTDEFSKLLDHINFELTNPSQIFTDKYKFSKSFFYNYNDVNNSSRVVKMVKQELETKIRNSCKKIIKF
ncbi:MAG: CDP-glycerol glycerophosphotransferase family protein [Victivallaceae bacterium]